MKMIRTEFHYPAATQTVPLSFKGARASREFSATAFPLPGDGVQSKSSGREAPAYARQLYCQIAAEQQRTEFLENVIFAALGASGLAGVAVSFL